METLRNNRSAATLSAGRPGYSQPTSSASQDRPISVVARANDRAAASYMHRRWLKSAAMRWDYRVSRRVLMEELKPMPADRIMEIGCGPGTWTREIASECRELVAVEISANMIAQASRYVQGLPVDFINSDFMLSNPEGKFDRIFSSRAIEYIADKEHLAQKISQLVVPGGTVVLITKTRFSLWRGRMKLLYRSWPFNKKTSAERTRSDEDSSSVRQYLPSPGQLSRAFAKCGFVTTNVRPVVMRLPICQQGFHEIPIVPDFLAPPFLAVASLLFEAGSHLPKKLAFLPLWFSESSCITLKSSGKSE